MERITLNDTVREALGEALLRLMQRIPFAQISISEIVKVAGVSRSSFYRNFSDKEELLCAYICDLYRDYFQREKVLHRPHAPAEVRDFLLPRFRFIREHQALFTVLAAHDKLYYFFRHIESDLILLLCGQEETLSPYYRAMCAGACAGVVRCWIERGFRDTDEELVELFTASTNQTLV